jgi:DNA-binding transcriptional LysR family regulator
MDKFRAMQTFVRIAEEGSLTAAARTLDSSLPATVRGLAALEADLGVRLFNRTTRRISLTDEGRQHLANCKQILMAVADAEVALTTQRGAPEGHLKITAPVLFGQMYAAPCITRFVQQHVRVRCSILLLDRVVNLIEEGVDVALRIGELKDSTLIAKPLGHIRRVVVASPDYLKRHGTPAHPKDLKNRNCVGLTEQSHRWGAFSDGGRPYQCAVSGNLEFNQSAPAIAACVAGIGLGQFLSYQVAPFVRGKQLQIVLAEFEPAELPISIVYPHARLLPNRTRVFIDWVMADLHNFQL